MINILYNIILSPITQIIEISYRVFSKMFSNTGIALVGVSLTVTLLCLPLYIVAEKWQETERDIQLKMKKEISRIKKFFKGDEQYMILSTYYRQNHYHPIMSLRSSFGILIQIPFFLAAYHTISSLSDLQGKSFLFIKDMSLPDALFYIKQFPVNILPVLMTLINCVSGFIYSKGHEAREKIQIYGMAFLFLIILYNSPAGLVVYWTMNNIFSLVKNIFYKMKNPLSALYKCFFLVALFVAIYILFLYDGGDSISKRLAAVFAIIILLPIPLYLKFINFLLDGPLFSINTDKKTRIGLFISSAISLTVLTGLVLPASLVLSSVQEFSNIDGYGNPTYFFTNSFWLSFGLITFWPACIFFLFKEKLQTIISTGYFCILLSALLNTYIFKENYGSMDVTLKFIDDGVHISKSFALLNIVILLLIFLSIIAFIRMHLTKIALNFNKVLLSTLVLFSVINISRINKEYNQFQNITENNSSEYALKSKYNLSKTKDNIVIFMLDRFESAYVDQILTDFPYLKDKLDGFIYYKNTVSPNGHTLISVPSIFGGYDYLPQQMNKAYDKTLKEKHNEALMVLPEILTKQADFEVTLSDLSWANYSYISDMSFAKGIDNITPYTLKGLYSGDFKKECQKPGFEKSSLSHVLKRNLFWVSLFRISPILIRPVVYYKGTWWEQGVKESSNSFTDWFSSLYFLSKITSVDGTRPSLSIITNEATHSNEDISMYDLPMNGIFSQTTQSYIINCVVLNEIAKFCDFLKDNNAYNNTRIILVSDHGIGLESESSKLYTTPTLNGYQKDHLNPLLMLKDFNKSGKIKTDMTFMCSADVPSIALKNLVDNPVNPFTGNSISTETKKDGIIVTTADLFMPYQSKSKYEFTVPDDSWFKVKDNIFIDANWSKIFK